MPALSTSSNFIRHQPVIETTEITAQSVSCDGGAGTSPTDLGHPLVYLFVDPDSFVDCPYCGRRFVRK